MRRLLQLVILLTAFPLMSDAQLTDQKNYTAYNSIRRMVLDGDNLWMTTEGGLVKYEKTAGHQTLFTRSNSGICDDDVIGLACRDGEVWIGSKYYGVDRYDGHSFKNYSNPPFFINEAFTELAYDPQGNLWVGGLNYLYKYDGQNWMNYTVPKADYSSYLDFDAIAFGVDGKTWFGCQGAILVGSLGYITKDGETVVISEEKQDIFQLALDKEGNVWYCCRLGLGRYDGTRLTRFTTENSPIPERYTHGLCIDGDNNVWFGSGSCLLCYDGTSFTSYQLPTENRVFCLLLDGSTIWVGTQGDGLFRFTNGRFEHITIQNATVSSKALDFYRQPTSVFDLQGRRLTDKPARGVYIEDGRKRVVK